MSQLAGAPVRLQFMRWDEHGWDNYAPRVLADLRAAPTRAGTSSASTTPRSSIPPMSMASDAEMPARRHPAAIRPGSARADGLNSGTQYDTPEPARDRQVAAALGHVLQDVGAAGTRRAADDLLRDGAARRRARPRGRHRSVRCSACRTSDGQVNDGFGQWRDALVAVAELAGWQPRVAACERFACERRDAAAGSRSAASRARRPAVVAEIEVNSAPARSSPHHLRAPRSPASRSTCPGSRTRSRAT